VLLVENDEPNIMDNKQWPEDLYQDGGDPNLGH
jgi:hypothetical protein